MFHFNNMEGIPVKIAESYKPPPRIYQLPQSIINKLNISAELYKKSTQFMYDFQLENKVLTQLEKWRHLRQSERDSRRERKEKRNQQKLLELELKQKQLLGAVSYPSATELSSSESDEDFEIKKCKNISISEEFEKKEGSNFPSKQFINFTDILQPTILQSCFNNTSNIKGQAPHIVSLNHKNNDKSCITGFNYKDFEDDNSSPFDNIELKTINDLDILAQVLHNTQLTTNEQRKSKNDAIKDFRSTENLFLEKAENKDASLSLIDSADKRIFNICNSNQQTGKKDCITSKYELEEPTSKKSVCNRYLEVTQCNNTSLFQPLSVYVPYSQQQNKGTFVEEPVYKNCNLINCNEIYVYKNQTYINKKNNSQDNTLNSSCSSDFNKTDHNNGQHFMVQENEVNPKSKSVPDIVKEMTEEVQYSKLKRCRNYSCNVENQIDIKEDFTLKNSSLKMKLNEESNKYYKQLAISTQNLVKSISLMGFPLDRVAKIAHSYGKDDKKIIEYLISFNELHNLGFDEIRIYEALIKSNNNKDEALEYLIP